MNQQASFCQNCGQPIRPGAAFCMNCGARTADFAGPAAGQPAVYQTAQPTAYPAVEANGAKPRKRPAISLILIGILVMAVGLISPMATIFGKSATGKITRVHQVIDSSSERMDYTYEINYEFVGSDGKSHTGSYRMNKVYNVSMLPGTGSSIAVKYIPGAYFINTPAKIGSPGLTMLLLCGLGIFLIVVGIKGGGNVTLGRKRRR